MDDPARQRRWTLCAALLILLPLLPSVAYNQGHAWLWFVRAGLAALLYLYVLCRVCRLPASGWLRLVLAIVLAEILALFLGLRLVSFFFQGESFNARFFFHLNPDSLTDAGSFPGLMAATLTFLLAVPLLVWASLRDSGPRHTPALRLALAALLLLPLDPDLATALQQTLHASQARKIDLAGLELEGTGLNLEALEPQLDSVTAGRNLVFVYLESLEKVYTEESIFPGLTPFLSEQRNEALFFSDLRSSAGATWTVAGMMASQCGTPLLTEIGPRGNDVLQNGFLEDATCLGDVLQAAGYHLTYVGGASTRFAGKGTFLRQHGYNEVLGLDELLPQLPNPDYLNNWGLYDDSTFSFALDKFKQLAANPEQPFQLTVLTVDTHHPAGTPSASCPRYPRIDNSILHAVHCTDWLLQRFIAELQAHPAWDNTVVVLMSDHLAMRNIAQHLYPEDYEREIYLAILNAGQGGSVDLPATHMDVAPTLLPLLGVRHEQRFLAGANLLDPQTAARQVDFDDPRRIAAIRFINSELLTQHDRNVCQVAAPALRLTRKRLQVAGKDSYLGLGGRAVPLESVGQEHVFVALLEEDGAVQTTMLVAAHNLPFFMHQVGSLHYLLLGSDAVLAPLLPGTELAPGLAVIFGEQPGQQRLLLQGGSHEGLAVSVDCGWLSASSGEEEGQRSPAAALAQLCPVPPEQAVVRLDRSRDRIEASRVATANQWYNSTLEGDGEGNYRIVALELLGPVSAEPPAGFCHAFFGRAQALIPHAQTEDGGAVSLLLEQVPGSTDRFRLLDSYEM